MKKSWRKEKNAKKSINLRYEWSRFQRNRLGAKKNENEKNRKEVDEKDNKGEKIGPKKKEIN